MSMSYKGPVKLIIAWTLALFLASVIICYLFISHKIDIIMGLTIGAFISIVKFLINSRNFNKILRDESPNIFLLIFMNVFTLALIFITLYVLLTKLSFINVYSIAGIFVGIGFIPLVILVGGILQSLYIIRNKF